MDIPKQQLLSAFYSAAASQPLPSAEPAAPTAATDGHN